jgi:hypothetical protein
MPRVRRENDMKPIGKFLLLLSLLLPLPGIAGYETLETNNPDIVIKRAFCVDYNIGGILVNKSAKPFRGRLKLAVRDEEGDIVGRHSIRLRASAENGTRFDMYYINTLFCSRQSLEFTVE